MQLFRLRNFYSYLWPLMKIQFNYIKEHKLLVNKWIGKWSMDDYKKEIHHFNKLHETTSIKSIIQDIRDLDFSLSDIEFIKLLVEIRGEIKNKDYKLVYITSKPQDLVFTHLYASEIQSANSYHSCSTIEKALSLLHISMSSNDFSKQISVLKN